MKLTIAAIGILIAFAALVLFLMWEIPTYSSTEKKCYLVHEGDTIYIVRPVPNKIHKGEKFIAENGRIWTVAE